MAIKHAYVCDECNREWSMPHTKGLREPDNGYVPEFPPHWFLIKGSPTHLVCGPMCMQRVSEKIMGE